ncbi:glycosyl-4,4'-diaponeurosporenoate acyltransferase [Marinilactibacillus psychrotolerans]|uniref:glycosyl-4,4'-diaponeurosporenoate acyltransferase CrtO family protein n=1 Tax=Marinilactibacillus psychrotolerans TaxID=191770 RepID=UPI0039B08C65
MTLSQTVFLLFLNIGIWFIIHLSISISLLFLPKDLFIKNVVFQVLFKAHKWEKNGQLYDSAFLVKSWKDKVPDGASLFNLGYMKKQLPSTKKKDMEEFIMETKRAELTHWLIMLLAPAFFLWNPLWAAWINIIYALCSNVPFIMIQRYNRPRLERIQRLKIKRIDNRLS